MNRETLIRGGTVVDGLGSPPRQADVLVKGGRIVAVGDESAAREAAGADARVVDLDGAKAGSPVNRDAIAAIVKAAGDVPVQITRTVQAGRYHDGRASPGGTPFSIHEGEFSIYDQYIAAIAKVAAEANESMENIGARRLHTLMEHLLEDILFDAPDIQDKNIAINRAYVDNKFKDIREDEDLSRYIL